MRWSPASTIWRFRQHNHYTGITSSIRNGSMPVLETSADQGYAHRLPTVSFRVVKDDKSLLAPAGVHSVCIKEMDCTTDQDIPVL